MIHKGNLGYEISFTEDKQAKLKIDNELSSEDRYFIFEITRYFMSDFLEREGERIKNGTTSMNEDDINKMAICESVLNGIAQQIGSLIYDTRNMGNELSDLLNNEPLPYYDFSVNSIDDLNKVKFTRFLVSDRWFLREEGLKVLVKENNTVFELQGGVSNENWTEI